MNNLLLPMQENLWIFLVLFYGICKGIREIIKKKSLEKNTAAEVLLFYTFLSVLLVLPHSKDAFQIGSWQLLLWIFLKSTVIFTGWTLGFTALSQLPVSLFGILELSGILFSTLLAILFLGERLSFFNAVGLVFVCLGLYLLKRRKNTPTAALDDASAPSRNAHFVLMAFAYALCNSISGTIDKYLRSDNRVSINQLQYWFMLFLLIEYAAYFLIRRIPIRPASLIRNYWVYLLAILLILGDRALFWANAGASRVTVMTLLKQSSAVCSVIGGRLVFHEKGIGRKLICTGIILVGIAITAFFG